MILGQASGLLATASVETSGCVSVITTRSSSAGSTDRTTNDFPKCKTVSPTSGTSAAYQYSVPEGSRTMRE